MRGRCQAIRFRPPMLVVGLCVSLLLSGCGAGALVHAADPGEGQRATVTVLDHLIGPPVPSGFVGISLEYPALTAYAGSNPAHINPVLVRLIEDLAPAQRPVIRIGGDSTDTSWWPVSGIPRPGGVTFTLTSRWLTVLHALTDKLDARLILGVDMEAGEPELARAEAGALVQGVGAGSVQALELGNEPGRYAMFAWYHDHAGRAIFARAHGYGLKQFTDEFATVAPLMPRGIALAGPALAGYDWMSGLSRFITGAPRLGLVTFHRYPLNRCFTGRRSPHYPSVPNLLTPAASEGLGRAVGPYATAAHDDGLPLRIDELNSVACGGKPGVSNTFASALWALDSLFAMAKAGAAGVNLHTFPGAAYRLFDFSDGGGRWTGTVQPEYYGALMFTQAAPKGSRLVGIESDGPKKLRAWSTRTTDGTTRVVLINDSLAHRCVVIVRSLPAHARASILWLSAPSAYATSGERLGGFSFGMRTDGSLGTLHFAAVRSQTPGQYSVSLPPASAALLTVSPGANAPR